MTERRGIARRVCVLGGTGFVGRHLVGRLGQLGVDSIVPTRHIARHRDLRLVAATRVVPVARFDSATLSSLIDGCDAVVNLIGILNERGHSGAGFWRAHVGLTETVIGACERTGVRRLIQVSALKANPEHGASHYLRTKGQAERLVAGAVPRGLQPTILRPSVIFGRDDSFINRFATLLRRSPCLPLARPHAIFAPVHVSDVSAALTRVLRDDATIGETYELCGPDTLSLIEIVTMIRDALGIRRAIVPLHDFLGATQAFVCDYLIPGKPFSLDNFRSLSVPSTCSSDGLARLGIVARDFASSVALLERRESPLARFRRAAGR